jgi:hypothetical protein
MVWTKEGSPHDWSGVLITPWTQPRVVGKRAIRQVSRGSKAETTNECLKRLRSHFLTGTSAIVQHQDKPSGCRQGHDDAE